MNLVVWNETRREKSSKKCFISHIVTNNHLLNKFKQDIELAFYTSI